MLTCSKCNGSFAQSEETTISQVCRTCGLEKAIEEYHSNKSNVTGHSYQCKTCANGGREKRRLANIEGQSAYWANHYLKHREEKKEAARRYYHENHDICRQRQAQWYIENKETHRQSGRAWNEANAKYIRIKKQLWRMENIEEARANRRRHYVDNKHMYIANGAKRRAGTIRATPPWVDFDAIKEIYRKSEELTRTTGVKHCVDHIIPLNHKLVCGLHVETNLQILTDAENTAKSNYFKPGPMKDQLRPRSNPPQMAFPFLRKTG